MRFVHQDWVSTIQPKHFPNNDHCEVDNWTHSLHCKDNHQKDVHQRSFHESTIPKPNWVVWNNSFFLELELSEFQEPSELHFLPLVHFPKCSNIDRQLELSFQNQRSPLFDHH